ncbi:MAG: polyprenyl synthetase family protein [Planctomycetes bacterium]|nr:polyprenyl synthetase family protein [Planctomycetota bacterium]
MSAPAWLAEGRTWVEAALERALPSANEPPARLHQAMRYALLGGGKRLRPALVRLVCLELGGTEAQAAAPAVALELVHTYSLVHDDLPAMDDDELRRGRPTLHVAFDEATAILVGDALLTLSFEVLAGDEPLRAREHARVLARAAGSRGMVGGQVLDLSLEAGATPDTLAALEDMHRRKTAALFAAACEMGAIAAGRAAERARCAAFGERLGRLFQAVDDWLDVTGDAATLGKTPGKDAVLARPTLVRALGLEGTRRRAEELASESRQAALELCFGPGTALHELSAFVLARKA